jgi:hypothetical protein
LLNFGKVERAVTDVSDENGPNAPKLGAFDLFLDDQDYLYTLLYTIDWRSQLDAIRLMIARNRNTGEAFSKAIDVDEAQVETYDGPYQVHRMNHNTDLKHESVYRDAAESMAAIGMVAPLIESTLGQALSALGEMYDRKGMSPGDHTRWKRSVGNASRWNCQFYFNSKKQASNNIILGLPQLAEACGLDKFLAKDFMAWFEAMFVYRNYMFHGGFEWTIERRGLFKKAIEEKNWGQWFVCSYTNDRPWIYYIRDDAIVAMPTMVQDMLNSLGRFTKSLPPELTSLPISEEASLLSEDIVDAARLV